MSDSSGGLVEKVAQAIHAVDADNAKYLYTGDFGTPDFELHKPLYLAFAAAAVQVVQDQLAEKKKAWKHCHHEVGGMCWLELDEIPCAHCADNGA